MAHQGTIAIDNGIYDQWGEHWYTGCDHVGLLRAQSAPLTAWVVTEIELRLGQGEASAVHTLVRASRPFGRASGADLVP
jgi:hypothetical protein